MSKINFKVIYGLVLVISLTFLSFRLSFTPVHLNQDEAMFALNAKSIADSGKDVFGRIFPFYFQHLDNLWATPVIVYWSSIFLKFLPFNEISIRLPTVLMGLIDIMLLMYLTHLLFKNKLLTCLSGIVLLTTPAFFINSRLMLDNIYPLPFLLLWLILLFKKKYFFAAFVLGIGIHSYQAPKVYFPIYLIISLAYLYFGERKFKLKESILILAGFVIPILFFIPWLLQHPDTISSQIGHAYLPDRNPGSNYIGNYLSYFDPGILFNTGDRTLVHSTGQAGVFLFPMFFLLAVGIISVLQKRDLFGKLILAGFLLYPLAPALINDAGRISRALVVIPFGVLLSVYGAKFLFETREKMLRNVAYFIFVYSLILFIVFLTDYFGNYRIRSQSVFNNNIGGAFESVLRSTKIRPVRGVYVDKNIFQAEAYFDFYEKKLNIFPSNVNYFDANKVDFTAFPADNIVAVQHKPESSGLFDAIETIREPNGMESYFVYWRDK